MSPPPDTPVDDPPPTTPTLDDDVGRLRLELDSLPDNIRLLLPPPSVQVMLLLLAQQQQLPWLFVLLFIDC